MQQEKEKNLSEQEKRTRTYLVVFAFILFSVSLIGIFYLFSSPLETVNYAFSYGAGLSMIVLPCTLPLAFVIVPLSMGRGYKKGLGMALLFGLGLSITITVYAVFIALAGQLLGLGETIEQATIVSRVLFVIGGAAALIFGLSELKLLRFELPSFQAATPKFIQNQGDYFKALFLGLFLGNAGVGCPNPLFYVLLGDIAVTGSVVYGGLLGFVHGIGRATPLIFLAILGILGVNATAGLVKRRKIVQKIIGFGLVFMGAAIVMLGAAHEWFEESFIHQGWNRLVEAVGGIPEIELHEHEGAAALIPDEWALWVFLALILIPILWYYLKFKVRSKKEALKNG